MAEVIETDPQTIAQEIQTDFARGLGEVLMPGDERRIFADQIGYVLAVQNNRAQLAFDCIDPVNCEGEILTARGRAEGIGRSEGRPAKIFATVIADQTGTVVVPEGTRVSLGGCEWTVDVDCTIYGAGNIPITCIDVHPSPESVRLQNRIPNSSELIGSFLDEIEHVMLLTSASLPHLYTQRAFADERNDDDAFRARVIAEIRNPRSYSEQLREFLPDASQIIETNPEPGVVELLAVYPGPGGFPVAPTEQERTALSEALMESPRRYQGDVVRVGAMANVIPSISMTVVCERGTSAVVAARFYDQLNGWIRSKCTSIIGEGIDVGDVVRLVDGMDHVDHVVVTAATYAIGGRSRQIKGNPGYVSGEPTKLVLWNTSSVIPTFKEVN